jgi:hypothetical protein
MANAAFLQTEQSQGVARPRWNCSRRNLANPACPSKSTFFILYYHPLLPDNVSGSREIIRQQQRSHPDGHRGDRVAANEAVKAGQLLARIDDRDLQAARSIRHEPTWTRPRRPGNFNEANDV